MGCPSYVFFRRDTGCYCFRYVVPAELRLVFGRTEIRRSLRTDNRKLAQRLGRRLSVLVERVKLDAMTRNVKDTPTFYLSPALLRSGKSACHGGVQGSCFQEVLSLHHDECRLNVRFCLIVMSEIMADKNDRQSGHEYAAAPFRRDFFCRHHARPKD